VIRLLVRLYPRWWRERYEAEFTEVLESEGMSPRVVADVFVHGVRVRLDLRRPVVRSCAAVAVVAVATWYATTHGYTDNLLWVPRTVGSAILWAIVVSGLLVVLVPFIRATARRVVRIRRIA